MEEDASSGLVDGKGSSIQVIHSDPFIKRMIPSPWRPPLLKSTTQAVGFRGGLCNGKGLGLQSMDHQIKPCETYWRACVSNFNTQDKAIYGGTNCCSVARERNDFTSNTCLDGYLNTRTPKARLMDIPLDIP